jgi:hypothetical protein
MAADIPAETPIPSSTTKPEYPRGVPSKFTPDGAVQPFPGNTIVCHLSPSAPLFAAMQRLYAALAASPLAPLYTLLPPASWHMTVFEGVCDQVRDPAHWPAPEVAAPDASLAEVTAAFAARLQGFEPGEAGRPPYRMRVVGYDPLKVGIGLTVVGETDEELARLRGLRDRLAERLGMRFPQHAVYGLHLSMAYLLRHLNEEQERGLKALLDSFLGDVGVPFELGTPEFCTFEDMFRFDRVMYLGESS